MLVQTGRGPEQHQLALKAGINGYRLTRDLNAAVNEILQIQQLNLL